MSKCSQQNHRELTGRFCSIHSFQLLQDFAVNPLWAGAGASPAQSHCSAGTKERRPGPAGITARVAVKNTASTAMSQRTFTGSC